MTSSFSLSISSLSASTFSDCCSRLRADELRMSLSESSSLDLSASFRLHRASPSSRSRSMVLSLLRRSLIRASYLLSAADSRRDTSSADGPMLSALVSCSRRASESSSVSRAMRSFASRSWYWNSVVCPSSDSSRERDDSSSACRSCS